MENQLAALKKALELGADIHINFHPDYFTGTPDEVQENKIKEVTELLGCSYSQRTHDGSKWFATPRDNTIHVNAFLDKESEQDASAI